MKKFSQVTEAWTKEQQAKLDAQFEKSTYRVGKKFDPPKMVDHKYTGHHYLEHEGKHYTHSDRGEHATHIKTGQKSWRYDSEEHGRVYVRQDGTVDKD